MPLLPCSTYSRTPSRAIATGRSTPELAVLLVLVLVLIVVHIRRLPLVAASTSEIWDRDRPVLMDVLSFGKSYERFDRLAVTDRPFCRNAFAELEEHACSWDYPWLSGG